MKVHCTPNCNHTLYLSSYRAKSTTRAHSLGDCVIVSLILTRCYTSALAPPSSATSPSCETHTHTHTEAKSLLSALQPGGTAVTLVWGNHMGTEETGDTCSALFRTVWPPDSALLNSHFKYDKCKFPSSLPPFFSIIILIYQAGRKHATGK